METEIKKRWSNLPETPWIFNPNSPGGFDITPAKGGSLCHIYSSEALRSVSDSVLVGTAIAHAPEDIKNLLIKNELLNSLLIKSIKLLELHSGVSSTQILFYLESEVLREDSKLTLSKENSK